MSMKDESEPRIIFCLGRKIDLFQKVHHNAELWTTVDGEPMEFEWNLFPGFTTLQLCNKFQEFVSKMGEPEQFQGRIIFMSMFNDISWRSEDNERECNANADLESIFAKRFPPER